MNKRFLTLLLLIVVKSAMAQSGFYDLGTIQKIEITFTQPNWDYQLDTAKHGSEGYLLASEVKINGVVFDSAGVKYKGNSSYDSTYVKNPIHIALDEFKNNSYNGYTDIKLGNGYSDPSMIREPLSYSILSNYMHCPKSNFAQVYINGIYVGIYSNTESINKDFCSDHFYSSGNYFYKCNPVINPSPVAKSSLRYLSTTDSSSYFNYYEVKSANGWNELVKVCDTVTNYSTDIPDLFDIDRVIWMLAFNNVLVNLDSYSGAFCQNYYLYKDNTNHYNPIIWDLNMAFGGFPFAGSGSSSLGTLNVTNMQQLPVNLHSSDVYWPLIKNVFSDPMYYRMYIAHMKTITDECFVSGDYVLEANTLQTLIDTAVLSDTNAFFSYSEFQNGMTGNVTVGSYVVPGISNLMNARATYLQSTTEFGYIQPSITNVVSSNTAPTLNNSFFITASVTNVNSSSVYLGYRFSFEDKFTRIMMYDDGLHGDGNAGDNIYGIGLNMLSAQLSYYIYAENSNAGLFSPQRAEHEYYTLNATIGVSAVGQVVINEFLASNVNDEIDDNNQHEDWIELINTTSANLNLYGMYISDDSENPFKFALPSNAFIPANGYLVIWADEDDATGNSVHANFKLSASGEQLLLSDISGTVHDSLSFGAQQNDVSIGRCPDAIGNFIVLNQTSAGATNCLVSVEEMGLRAFSIYPNPANQQLTISVPEEFHKQEMKIINVLGQLILTQEIFSSMNYIDLSDWRDGIYIISINGIQQKFVVQK